MVSSALLVVESISEQNLYHVHPLARCPAVHDIRHIVRIIEHGAVIVAPCRCELIVAHLLSVDSELVESESADIHQCALYLFPQADILGDIYGAS